MAGNFGDFFSGIRFPRKQRMKNPYNIWGKFRAKFGAKNGTKIRKIRVSFVLQLFRHRLGQSAEKSSMRSEMITRIIQKQFFCVTNVGAIGK